MAYSNRTLKRRSRKLRKSYRPKNAVSRRAPRRSRSRNRRFRATVVTGVGTGAVQPLTTQNANVSETSYRALEALPSEVELQIGSDLHPPSRASLSRANKNAHALHWERLQKDRLLLASITEKLTRRPFLLHKPFETAALTIQHRMDTNDILTLSDALSNGALPSLERLEISNIKTIGDGGSNIGDGGSKALANALRTNTVLTNLSLRLQNIEFSGAIAMAEALKSNTALKLLDLAGNDIGINGAIAMAEALKVNTVLESLNLYRNSIGDLGANAMAGALEVNTVLTYLNLRSNALSPNGCIAIGEALTNNAVLTSVNLKDNSAGPEGGKAIAKMLQLNTTLKSLSIANTNLTRNKNDISGVLAIAEALKKNTALTQLDISSFWIDDESRRLLQESVNGRDDFFLFF